MHLKRSTAAAYGREAVEIIEAGSYTAVNGDRVEIADLVRQAVEGTRTYPPDDSVPFPGHGTKPTVFAVQNQSTLAAARQLAHAGHRPVALNFASAKHPGGGFLGGARAQEESLCRSSALYACLLNNQMYDFHRASSDELYSHYAIYSPDVPVFRDDDGDLLATPYLCSFITCPAANAKVVLERDRGRRSAIRKAMKERVERVLAIAAAHDHEALVLGAWGCGVFGNDTEEVADLFRQALTTHFQGIFGNVVFAILDWSEEQRFIGPFIEKFKGL
jgi:uncharacterized protein (TIGR02452 family)